MKSYTNEIFLVYDLTRSFTSEAYELKQQEDLNLAQYSL
jgi:hypothetical protein